MKLSSGNFKTAARDGCADDARGFY